MFRKIKIKNRSKGLPNSFFGENGNEPVSVFRDGFVVYHLKTICRYAGSPLLMHGNSDPRVFGVVVAQGV